MRERESLLFTLFRPDSRETESISVSRVELERERKRGDSKRMGDEEVNKKVSNSNQKNSYKKGNHFI